MNHNLILLWTCNVINVCLLIGGGITGEMPLTAVVIVTMSALYFAGRWGDSQDTDKESEE